MQSLRIALASNCRRWSGVAALCGATLITACNASTDTFVGAPVAINATGGEGLNAEVGTDLGPFVVKVVDTAGTGVAGVNITFTVSGPATLITTTAQSDKDGNAITSITLGHTVGNISVTATAAGIATPAVIHASSFAGPATKFTIAGGQGQSAPHGTPLTEDLTVAVTDQYDNPLMNVLVTWQPSAGSLGATTSRTTANGRTVNTFVPALGAQTVQASTILSSGATATLLFTLTGT